MQHGATCCSVLQCVAAWFDADVFPVKILGVLWYAKDVCVCEREREREREQEREKKGKK